MYNCNGSNVLQWLSLMLQEEIFIQIQAFNPDKQVYLETEVSDEEMRAAAMKVVNKQKKTKSLDDAKDAKILSVVKMLQISLRQRIQDGDDTRPTFLQLWKGLALSERFRGQRTQDLVSCLDRETLKRLGLQIFQSGAKVPPQFVIETEGNWFDVFWGRQEERNFSAMSSDQLELASKKLQDQVESFWRFKCKNVITTMNLHLKRRARLHMAFAFQHYKFQTQKAKVAQLMINNTQSQASINIFRGQMRGGYLTLDPDGTQNPMEGAESQGSSKLNTDQAHLTQNDNLISIDQRHGHLNTPKLAAIQSGTSSTRNNGDQQRRKSTGAKRFTEEKKITAKGNRNTDRKLIDTMESQISQHTYTGISDIIMQGRHQQALKRQSAVLTLVSRKIAQEQTQSKYSGFNRWKGFIRDLEMTAIKIQIKRLTNDVANLKFQEQVMRTSFRVQKSELESKVSELVSHILGSTGSAQAGTGSAL